LFKTRSLAIFATVVFLGTSPAPAEEATDPMVQLAAALEARLDARIGLVIHDLESPRSWEYRADERFPMASTFKALACAALLSGGEAVAATPVLIEASDLEAHSPVTKDLVGHTVAVSSLCEATLRTSDNTAANYVLEILGGPDAVTAFARAMGDEVTRLDRWEPELNEGLPGLLSDTTSPRAMASLLEALVLGDALATAAQQQLTAWLLSNAVGDPLLRAGVPADWRVADRTGAGGHGTRGIVAVMWPPQREPIVAAIYLTETTASMADRNAAFAEIGATLAALVNQ
jgi:beta-lactamase class A